MIRPLYDMSDRIMLRNFPDCWYSKDLFLDMRKKHVRREFSRIFTRRIKAFK